MQGKSLIDRIAQMAGCECLSDLRFAQKKWGYRMVAALQEIDASEYSPAEWNKLVCYIMDSHDAEDIEDSNQAKAALIIWLNEKQ